MDTKDAEEIVELNKQISYLNRMITANMREICKLREDKKVMMERVRVLRVRKYE